MVNISFVTIGTAFPWLKEQIALYKPKVFEQKLEIFVSIVNKWSQMVAFLIDIHYLMLTDRLVIHIVRFNFIFCFLFFVFIYIYLR